VYRSPDSGLAEWLREMVDSLPYEVLGPLALVAIVAALGFATISWYRRHPRGTPRR